MLGEIETIQGVFIKESKNRFLCEVLVDKEIMECYVPSSSRIENYLSLANKEVLLTRNKVSGRTKFSLFAVKLKGKFVILNLNKVNSIIKLLIEANRIKAYMGYKAFSEKSVDKYKADLLLLKNDQEIIVEIKGVIADSKVALFPNVYSERGVRQLEELKHLLLQGKKVHYLLVSISPFVNEIRIDDGDRNGYVDRLNECLTHGMTLSALKIIYDGKKIGVSTRIRISQ